MWVKGRHMGSICGSKCSEQCDCVYSTPHARALAPALSYLVFFMEIQDSGRSRGGVPQKRSFSFLFPLSSSLLVSWPVLLHTVTRSMAVMGFSRRDHRRFSMDECVSCNTSQAPLRALEQVASRSRAPCRTNRFGVLHLESLAALTT